MKSTTQHVPLTLGKPSAKPPPNSLLLLIATKQTDKMLRSNNNYLSKGEDAIFLDLPPRTENNRQYRQLHSMSLSREISLYLPTQSAE